MLFEKRSHHGNRNLVTHEKIDRYGQIHAIKGQGFRHISIWEEFESRKALVHQTRWVENAVGEVVYQAKAYDTLQALIKFRDSAYPGGAVYVWEGDETGKIVFADRPQSASKPVSKKKKQSRKIKWP